MLNGSITDLPTNSQEALEPAMYPARLVSLVDIGSHDSPWGLKRQIVATFELPTEQGETDEGEPRARLLSAFFNVPDGYTPKAKLVQFVETLQKKAGEPYGALLGRACQIEVTEKQVDGKTQNRVGAVTKVGKGMDVADPISDLLLVSEDSWDNLDNLNVPNWIKEKIEARVQDA